MLDDIPSLKRQLAVALDIPVERLPEIGFGGLLATAFVMGVTIDHAKSYYRDLEFAADC